MWTPTTPFAGPRTPRPGPALVCVCSSFLAGSAGRPPGHVLVRLTFPLAAFFFCFARPPRAGVAPLFAFFLIASFLCAPPLSPSLSGFRPRVPWALALCFPLPPSSFFCAPVLSGFVWFPAPGALGLGAVCCLFCWSPACRIFVRSRCFCVFRLAVGCALVVAAPPSPLDVSRFSSLPLAPPPFFFLCCFALARLLGARRRFSPSAAPPPPPPPPPVCFVGLPLLGSPFSFGAFVFPAWPLLAPWWLLPPPPPLCLVVFVAVARSPPPPPPPPFFYIQVLATLVALVWRLLRLVTNLSCMYYRPHVLPAHKSRNFFFCKK